jgi:SAM-dependent methyltransferase
MQPEIRDYYETGVELDRLAGGSSLVEFIRTKEILDRFLPSAPTRVLDVGGGPGAYADWLTERGYAVRLVDATPLHVARANERAEGRFEAVYGDATRLDEPDAAYGVVLLLGPLYHLLEREDRLTALREAHRVLQPGGLLAAAAISRFAPIFDALIHGNFRDPDARARGERELADGRHFSPPGEQLFTTSYFHRVEELEAEVTEAGFALDSLYGVEGPGWLRYETLDDESARQDVLEVARILEQEPTVIGMSAHLLAIARSS